MAVYNYMIYSNDYVKKYRQVNHKIDDIFWCRWSPRAMTGEALNEADVLSLLEAARFAPSSFNEQPWRFIYSLKKSPAWQKILDNLVSFNQSWAKNSGAFIILLSRRKYRKNDKLNDKASFDSGAAWQNIALQATMKHLVVHGMGGFDSDKLRQDFNISEDYNIELVIALGKIADKSVLGEELSSIEEPSDRLKVVEISQLDEFNF